MTLITTHYFDIQCVRNYLNSLSSGLAQGSSVANGVSKILAQTVGTANGLATANGIGAARVFSIGTANGLATASGTSTAIISAAGTANGLAAASGIGVAGVTSAGTANGLATAAGVGVFTPLNVSGLVNWQSADFGLYQDTSLTTPATSDGTAVAGWQDRSGNNNHLLQATSGSRPLLKLAIQNSMPVVRFDGVDDFLEKATFAGGALAQPLTAFFVYRLRTGGGVGIYDGAGGFQCGFGSFGGNWDFYGSTDTNAGPPDTSWHIVSCVYHGATSKYRFDGGTEATISPGTSGETGLTVGSAHDGSLPSAVDVGEVLVYSNEPSSDDKTLLFAYLDGRWAIY